MPRILCLAGSPRRHGNSEQLLDAFIAGAVEGGAEADKVPVVEWGIAPCNGCNRCSDTGKCVIADRMRELYPLLDDAHGLVVATPVFFATVPATLKAVYDRCQPYWARRYVMHEPPPPRRRPGALLIAHAGGDPYGAEAAVTTTQSVFAVLGVDLVMRQEVVGVDEVADMGGRPDALTEARDGGLTLARELGAAL